MTTRRCSPSTSSPTTSATTTELREKHHGGFPGPDEAGRRAQVEDGGDAGRDGPHRGRGHGRRRDGDREAVRQGRPEERAGRSLADEAGREGDRRGPAGRGA